MTTTLQFSDYVGMCHIYGPVPQSVLNFLGHPPQASTASTKNLSITCGLLFDLIAATIASCD